jgi:hypothetical protein
MLLGTVSFMPSVADKPITLNVVASLNLIQFHKMRQFHFLAGRHSPEMRTAQFRRRPKLTAFQMNTGSSRVKEPHLQRANTSFLSLSQENPSGDVKKLFFFALMLGHNHFVNQFQPNLLFTSKARAYSQVLRICSGH